MEEPTWRGNRCKPKFNELLNKFIYKVGIDFPDRKIAGIEIPRWEIGWMLDPEEYKDLNFIELTFVFSKLWNARIYSSKQTRKRKLTLNENIKNLKTWQKTK